MFLRWKKSLVLIVDTRRGFITPNMNEYTVSTSELPYSWPRRVASIFIAKVIINHQFSTWRHQDLNWPGGFTIPAVYCVPWERVTKRSHGTWKVECDCELHVCRKKTAALFRDYRNNFHLQHAFKQTILKSCYVYCFFAYLGYKSPKCCLGVWVSYQYCRAIKWT